MVDNRPDQAFERKFVVRLFELAYLKAVQLEAEKYHPEDLYINASSILNHYDTTVLGA